MYKKDGYVLIKNAIDVDLLKSIKNEILGLFPGDIFDVFNNDFEMFMGCANSAQSLLSIYNLSSILGPFLSSVGFKKPVINTKPLISFSHKKLAKHFAYWKMPPHQDWHSTLGSLNGVTVWIPFVDVIKELGPLEVSPGSHLLGPLFHMKDHVYFTEENGLEFVPIEMNVGDILIFSNFLMHRSGENISDFVRLTSHYRYDDILEPTFIQRKYKKDSSFSPSLDQIANTFV